MKKNWVLKDKFVQKIVQIKNSKKLFNIKVDFIQWYRWQNSFVFLIPILSLGKDKSINSKQQKNIGIRVVFCFVDSDVK